LLSSIDTEEVVFHVSCLSIDGRARRPAGLLKATCDTMTHVVSIQYLFLRDVVYLEVGKTPRNEGTQHKGVAHPPHLNHELAASRAYSSVSRDHTEHVIVVAGRLRRLDGIRRMDSHEHEHGDKKMLCMTAIPTIRARQQRNTINADDAVSILRYLCYN
jgi:hypothetical protein